MKRVYSLLIICSLAVACYAQTQQDDLSDLPQLPADHPALVEAEALAKEAGMCLKNHCFTLWADYGGRAMRLLRETYGRYPVTQYDPIALWSNVFTNRGIKQRTDGKALVYIEKEVFYPHLWESRKYDVQWLLKGTIDTATANVWDKMQKNPATLSPQQLENFANRNQLVFNNEDELRLWIPDYYKREQKLKAADKLAQLLKKVIRKSGRQSNRYAMMMSVLAHYHTANNEYEEAIDYHQKAADCYKHLGDNMGFKLATLSRCELLAKMAHNVIYAKDRNWTKADSLKIIEFTLLSEALGDTAMLTRWVAMERAMLPKKLIAICNEEYVIYNKEKSDPNAEVFAKGVTLYRQGDYRAAITAFLRCADLDKGAMNTKDYRHEYVKQWLANCYLKLKDYNAVSKYKRQYLQPPIDRSLTTDIDYLLNHTKYSQERHERQVELARQALGDNSPEYAHVLTDVAKRFNDFNREYAYLYKALHIYEKQLGSQHPAYAYTLTKLSKFYGRIGDRSAQIDCMERAANCYNQAFGRENGSALYWLDQAIKVAIEAGYHTKTVKLLKKMYDATEEEEYLLKLAEETAQLTDTVDGKSPAQRAVEIMRRVHIADSTSSAYYDFQEKLASYLQEAGHSAEGESIMRSLLHHPRYSYRGSLIDLGYYYQKGKEWKKLLDVARQIFAEENLQLDHISEYDISPISFSFFSLSSTLLASLSLEKLNYLQEAESIWRWPLAALPEMLKYKNLSTSDKNYAQRSYLRALLEHSILLQKTKQRVEAATEMKHYAELNTRKLMTQLIMKNTEERESFWTNECWFYDRFLPHFAYTNQQRDMVESLYNTCLLSKGLLLNTEAEIGRVFTESGDSAGRATYLHLQQDRLLLTNQLELDKEYRVINTDSLQKSVKAQEQNLAGMLKNGEATSIVGRLMTGWQEVRSRLGKNDAAIEFVAVPTANNGTIFVALTLRQDFDTPHMITLFEQQRLKALSNADIYTTDSLYRILWQPLTTDLQGVQRIYFSSAGALHQIAIEYLPGLKGRELYRLSSTRELVRPHTETRGMEAALYGGIQYELSDKQRADLSHQASTAFRDVPDLRTLRGAIEHMPVLEGSLLEVQDISRMMAQRHIPALTAIGMEATEESFKALSGKGMSLIHLSTHGFYQPAPAEEHAITDEPEILLDNNTQTTREDRSLSRSGLLLTGAADYLFGNIDNMFSDDGVLTAKEISRLDFQGVDLVVLSACETGLGDITGEGVYGLQRGFKKAGAQTLLISLWKVEDDATRVMMTEFYRLLLEGKSKRDAFVKAQQHLRTAEGGRFNRWECWAAFVMLD